VLTRPKKRENIGLKADKPWQQESKRENAGLLVDEKRRIVGAEAD
jgi:hypothetical protein